MKFIVAMIRPFILDEVRAALDSMGVVAMTVTEVAGVGRQKGHAEIYRGSEYYSNTTSKVKMEIGAPDNLVTQIVEMIREKACTDKIGDGKIFVLDLPGATRVRTGETGEKAL